MRQTSLDAYESIKSNLTNKQFQVYAIFRIYGNMTNQEVANKLAWPINRVTGRTGELVKHIMLEAKGFKKVGGYRHTIWGIMRDDKQGEMFV